MAFGAKVKLALDSGSASKLAGEIQKAVDSAAKQNFTIKINKIDASGAINDLRSQLTTMLSGLKISGVKEFLGTEGVGEAYKAAQKAAEAQVNARANVLKTLQSSIDNTFKRGNNITDTSAVGHITQEYNELCGQIERAKTLEGDAFRDAITQINQKRTALLEYINAQIQAARQSNQSNQQEIASMKQIVSLYKQLTNYADKNPRVMKNDTLGSELQGYINELQSAANGTITLSPNRLKEIGNSFASISKRAREAHLEGKSLGDVIAGAYQKFGGWMLVTQSLTKAIHTIKQMISTVKELDTAMTELRKVSDLTDLGYDQVFDKAIERAKTYGATVSDTITATADFSRLGYGIEDATKLADASIVYKNVGDGIENITEASESIISTMKAFGIEATDSMQIVDKFNEVGNHFAISSKGIGDALQRSASALAAAGNTIDESIGLAVGMNTVLQDPQKVGTVLKTASMYLRAAKTDAEAAGEATDGMANSVSELRDELLTLTKGKVDIMADETTFKSTTQIYRELAAVWKDLADIDQANILELIGGKRNATANAALLQNFQDVEEAIKTAANSSGSALAENEKQLASIEGKISLFKAAFQGLSATLFPTESLKGFVDAGTGLLNFLSKAITLLGGFGNTLAIIGVAIAALRFQDAVSGVKLLANSFTGLKKIFDKSIVSDFLTIRKAAKETGKTFAEAATEMGASVGGMAATAGIMAATLAVSIGVAIYQAYRRAKEEAWQNAIEAGDKASEESTKIREAYEAYESASSAYNNNTGSKEELTSATNALLSALGIEESQVENLISKYGTLSEALRQVSKESLAKQTEDLRSAYKASEEVFADRFQPGWFGTWGSFTHNDQTKKWTDYLKDRGLIRESQYGVGGGIIGQRYLDGKDVKAAIEEYEYLLKVREELGNAVKQGVGSTDELTNANLYKTIDKQLNKGKAEYEAMKEAVQSFNQNIADQRYLEYIGANGVPKTVAEYQHLRDIMMEAAKEGGVLHEQFAGTDNDIESAISSLLSGKSALSSLVEQARTLKEIGVITPTVSVDEEKTKLESFAEAVKASLSGAGMSGDNIQSITDRYKDLANFDASKLFEKTENGIHLNTRALRELETEYNNLQKQNINDALQDQIKRYNELSDKINEWKKTGIGDAALYTSQQAVLAQQIEDTATLASQYDGLTSAYQRWIEAQSMGEEGDMYDTVSQGLENMKKLYDDGLVGTNEFRSAVQLMTNFDVSNWSVDDLMTAYQNGYPYMVRYFTEGQEGCQNFLNDVSNLNKEWAHMNEDGSWEINFGEGSDEDIAEKLGISVDAVQAILRKLSDYGFDINLDSIFSDIDTVESEITKANEMLKDMGKTDIDFDITTSSLDSLTDQITTAKDILQDFKNEDGTINLSAEGASEVVLILETLISRRQELQAPAVMSVETSGVTEASSEIMQAIQLLQQFVQAQNELNMDAEIGLDTTDAQNKVNGLADEIRNIDPEILASLGINTDSIANISASITALTPELMVKAGVDPALVDAYIAEEHKADGTVTWTNNTSAVDTYIATEKTASGTVWWTNKETNSRPTGGSTSSNPRSKSGDVGARGTAFVHGTWGTKSSGVALGGELGQELVVRDGRFFTIGDESAEFFKFKKDDIIFNAEQTKQIFDKGKITWGNRRGVRAMAEGTAFSNGVGRFFKGGQLQKTTSNTKASTKSTNTKSTSKSTTNTKSSSSDTEKALEEELKKMQEAIKKTIASIEHQIFIMGKLAEPGQPDSVDIIDLYTQAMDAVHEQAEAYRAKGLDENSEYIQEMQKQWWEFHDKIAETISDAYEKARERIENSIELVKIYAERNFSAGNFDAAEQNISQIISYYDALKDSYHEQAEELRGLGYTDDSNEVSELMQDWAKAHTDAIETVADAYENLRKHIENAVTLNTIWQGRAIDNNDYRAVKEYTDKIIEYQKQMQESLHEQAEYYRAQGYADTSDEISKLMEAWNDCQEEIVNTAKESYQALVDYANDAVDKIQDLYSKLKDAAKEFAESGYVTVDAFQAIIELGVEYMGYLKNENGLLVISRDRINQMIAAKTEQLAITTALNYVEQLSTAVTTNNIHELERLLNVKQDINSVDRDYVYSLLRMIGLDETYYKQALEHINILFSLYDSVADGIGRGAEDGSSKYGDMKDALDDILDLVMELIKYESEQRVKALEEQIDKYKEIIDLKKESLKTTKEENDYNKQLTSKVKQMAELQERIARLSLDDSREAQAERISLEKELAELQEDTADYQADYAYDRTVDMLDDEYDAYEKAKQKQIEREKETVSSTQKVYELAIQRIEEEWDTLFDDIIAWNYEAGSRIESEIIDKWKLAIEAVKEYGSFVKAVNHFNEVDSKSESDDYNVVGNYTKHQDSGNYAQDNNIKNKMKQNSIAYAVAGAINDASQQGALMAENRSLAKQLSFKTHFGNDGVWYDTETNSALYQVTATEVASAIVKLMKSNSSQWTNANASRRSALDAQNSALGAYVGQLLKENVYRDNDGVWWIGNSHLYDKYHTGGVVGHNGTTKDNEILALLEKGEVVLNDSKKNGLYRVMDIASYMIEKFGAKLDGISGLGSIVNKPIANTIGELRDKALGSLSNITDKDITYTIESVEVNAPVQVLEKLDESAIREHARTIGTIAEKCIREGFTKRGVGSPASLF